MSSFLPHEATEATKHWPIFHDGPVGKFLRHAVNKKIEEARTKLESAVGDDLLKAQGEVAALRWLKVTLAQADVELFAKTHITNYG